MIIPIINEPEVDNKIISRFLSKVAIECFLYKFLDFEGWYEEIIDHPGLQSIIKYARFGEGTDFWPYHQRRIYSEETRFNNSKISEENYEILHEFQFLVTKESHYYFVLAIMGIEYAINLGGPGIDSYKNCLSENNHKSILEDSSETKSSG